MIPSEFCCVECEFGSGYASEGDSSFPPSELDVPSISSYEEEGDDSDCSRPSSPSLMVRALTFLPAPPPTPPPPRHNKNRSEHGGVKMEVVL